MFQDRGFSTYTVTDASADFPVELELFMTRRPHSFSEEIIALIARLPWWLYLAITLLSFSFFHWYAGLPLEQTRGGSGFLERGISAGLRQGAVWAQYLVPLFVFPAALLAMYQKWKRDGLYEGIARNPSADCLKHLSRHDFQFLVAHYFSRRGFDIAKVKVGTAAHAAFLAVKGSEKYLVICESNQIGGLDISLNRDEVKTIKRIRVDQ